MPGQKVSRLHATYVALAVVGILYLILWGATLGEGIPWMSVGWVGLVLGSGVYVIVREHGSVDDAQD